MVSHHGEDRVQYVARIEEQKTRVKSLKRRNAEMEKEERATRQWKKEKATRCPKCDLCFEKTDGWDHMTYVVSTV